MNKFQTVNQNLLGITCQFANLLHSYHERSATVFGIFAPYQLSPIWSSGCITRSGNENIQGDKGQRSSSCSGWVWRGTTRFPQGLWLLSLPTTPSMSHWVWAVKHWGGRQNWLFSILWNPLSAVVCSLSSQAF
jgi:hypothetical protein